MEVKLDDVQSEEVIELLQQHLIGMQAQTPPESVHALELDAYKSSKLELWTAWSDGQLAGCGALKDLGGNHGEIKSMRTKDEYLRQGVADVVLDTIISYAINAGMLKLSLETGATIQFSAAQAFYARRGFKACKPFGDYQLDPHSLYLTKAIDV